MPWLTPVVYKQGPGEPLTRLPRFGDGPERIRFRHIVHPYRDSALPVNTAVQSITFDTIAEARRDAARECRTALVVVTLPEEVDLAPVGAILAAPLSRTVGAVARFAVERRLPLLFDILENGAAAAVPESAVDAAEPEFVVMTNSDIHLQPPFYRVLATLIRQGYDVITINRRTIDVDPQDRVFSPLFMVEQGSDHPGFDCFAFPAAMLRHFARSDACCGVPHVMRSLLFNLVAHAGRFLMLTRAQATYHLGDDRYGWDPRFADYPEFNISQGIAVIRALARDPEKARRLADFVNAHEAQPFRDAVAQILAEPGLRRGELAPADRVPSVESLAEAAVAAADRGEWPAAVAAAQACLAAAPGHPSALAWRRLLGRALLAGGRCADAEEVYRDLIRDDAGSVAGYKGLAHATHNRKDWPAAARAWRECIERFPANPEVEFWRFHLGLATLELGRLDEAEALFAALARERADRFHGFVGLARVADARRDWHEAAARWQEACRRFPDHPARREQWDLKLAWALVGDKAWGGAHEAWSAIAGRSPQNAVAAAWRLHSLRAWKGPTEEVARLAMTTLEAFPNDVHTLRECAHIARSRGDGRSALALYRRWLALEPSSVEAAAQAMEAACRIADLAAAAEIAEGAPPALVDLPGFRCRVLVPWAELRADFGAGLRLLQGIDEASLDEPSALAVARFLNAAARTEELISFLSGMVARFPRNTALAHRYLVAIHNVRGQASFEAEKARLLAGLDDAQRTEVLLGFPAPWLSPDEMAAVIRQLAAEPDVAAREHRIFAFACRTESEILEPFVARLESSGGVMDRLGARLLASALRDRRRLAHAGLDPCRWSDFAAEASTLAEDFGRFFEEGAATGALCGAAVDAVRTVRALARRSRSAWLHTRESYWNAASFAAWLVERIRRREPTSVVRLGDGEGNFLAYGSGSRAFEASDRRRIQQTWWGREHIDGAHAEAVTSALATAVTRADALGVPEPWLLLRDMRALEPTCVGRGEAAIVRFLATLDPADLAAKALVASKVHQDLEGWGLYREILAPVTSVSVVSCHDLARPLAERFGLAVRRWYEVPPEHRYAGMFDRPDRARGEPFFPAVFERLMRTLDPDPGEVVLVAAGFLGKLLCDRIRERGGIAVDVGGAADGWMGHRTRVETIGELDFDAPSSLIEGQPFAETFDAGSIDPAEPCRSDGVRRHNLAGRFADLFGDGAALRPGEIYPLRVIGHPRCGSTYVARRLHGFGLAIGHERPAEDGMCSWIHAVDDLNPPYRAPAVLARQFRTTLAYVRDPAAAVPSIMLENCETASFAFRRFHIARRCGVDIAARRDPLERAVESYLRWMEIVARQEPLFTLRVERFEEDWQLHADEVARSGLRRPLPAGPQVEEPPRDLNSFAQKFSRAKPEVPPARYRALPGDLAERLAGFCARHRYAFPGDLPERG